MDLHPWTSSLAVSIINYRLRFRNLIFAGELFSLLIAIRFNFRNFLTGQSSLFS
jgi:hypothetical protein